jgi:hypothetical protein
LKFNNHIRREKEMTSNPAFQVRFPLTRMIDLTIEEDPGLGAPHVAASSTIPQMLPKTFHRGTGRRRMNNTMSFLASSSLLR